MNKLGLNILCLRYINCCVVKFNNKIGTAIYSLQQSKKLKSAKFE